MRRILTAIFLTTLLATTLLATTLAPALARAATVRLKELAEVQGMRENELFGYGLVVGLNGTGDTEQVFFTNQSMSGMLGRLGVRVDPRDVRVRNVAAVMVTTKLPTFARAGTKLDVTVSSIGNARSLEGGVLVLTPLSGADGQVYAAAQGALQVGGFNVQAQGVQLRRNTTNTGRVPNGATIERAVMPQLGKGPLFLGLRKPDFTNASRATEAINAALGDKLARAVDAGTIEVTVSPQYETDPVALLAALEAVELDGDARAKVVVSERTGTVVAGERVRIRPVAVAHGGLQVAISTQPQVSQPAPLTNGSTVTTNATQGQAKEEGNPMVALGATATVDELAKALNSLGVTPRDMVVILQAIRAAGALDADLEVL
jgi:flagellar P-ring protein precursor FlgI